MEDATYSAERLREVLLDLEQAQRREKDLRAQSDALLSGLRALSEATTPDELLSRVLDALREPLAFDAAFVLRQGASAGTLVCAAATTSSFLGTTWAVGKTFSRPLTTGRVTVHLDTSCIAEWLAQPPSLREEVGSAICIPLRGSSETALLVCTRRERRGFQPSHEQMAKRFQPLATQALRDVERIAQVERANREMRLVLDAVDQGLLTVDRSMQVVGETSAPVLEWFGPIAPGTRFADVLARLSPRTGAQFSMCWEQVEDAYLPLPCALDLFPRTLTAGKKTLALDLRPIGDETSWTRMLVVVSDITVALERERLEERARELASVVGRIVHDRDGFLVFQEEAAHMLEELAQGTVSDKERQFRALHTLKGNASMMGLGTIAKIAGRLEERLADGALPTAAFEPLTERWLELQTELSPLLARHTRRGIVVTEGDYQWLMRELLRSTPGPTLARVVREWPGERTEVLLERLAEQARLLATRLGKTHVTVRVECEERRLDVQRWQPLFAALTHAVRNALDHGIETAEQRAAANKPTESELVFRSGTQGDGWFVEVEDDGRGIDWSAIAAKAAERGLPHETHDELVRALLADGLTTRREADEISGRGVGASALAAAALALGGRLQLDSRSGRGTRVRCVFPLRAT